MTEHTTPEFEPTPSMEEREKMSNVLYQALYEAVNKHAQGMPTFNVDQIVNAFAAEITTDTRAIVEAAMADISTHHHEGTIQ